MKKWSGMHLPEKKKEKKRRNKIQTEKEIQSDSGIPSAERADTGRQEFQKKQTAV